MKQGESWNSFQLRADKLLSRVNDSNFITVTDEQYSIYLRGAVEHDPVFAIAVRESELRDEDLEATKCTLSIAYERAKAKSYREQAMTTFKPRNKAMLSSDVDIDSQPTSKRQQRIERKTKGKNQRNKDFSSLAKALIAELRPQEHHDGQSKDFSRSKGSRSSKSERLCFSFKKHHSCPRGKDCQYKHDPSLGDVNNTRLPEGYVCNICNVAGHWRSKCTSDEAKRLRERYQAGHKKRAMIAREVIETDTSNSVISSPKSSLPEAKDYAMFTKVNPKSYVGYFDTGASKTILGMKTAFSNLQILDKPVTFQTAQDSKETLSATHGGTAILKIQGITMIYEGAVYIEGSPNLIALGYITRSCGQYSAELSDGVLIISPKDNMSKKTDTIRVVAEQDVFPVEFEAIGSTYTEQAYFALLRPPWLSFSGVSSKFFCF